MINIFKKFSDLTYMVFVCLSLIIFNFRCICQYANRCITTDTQVAAKGLVNQSS